MSAIALVSVVALYLDAPLGPPANPGLSPNPTKAPWYFACVQEMLVHFHPTFALLIVLALAAGAFFLLPYLGGGAASAGVWFELWTVPVGSRISEFPSYCLQSCLRVLRRGGRFVLNISNHMRDGKEIPVTEWHIRALCDFGLKLVNHFKVETPRLRNGENYEKRVLYESVVVFHA